MTSTLTATGPNAEQIEYWNSDRAARWVANEDRLDALIGPFGAMAIEAAAPARGERVLDVGCGCGATSLALGERVSTTGHVLGVDISTPMVERARARARDAGLSHVVFANADAQTHAFEPASRDLVFSRFGVMFFADPPRAFANLRGALRPGGRLAFVCWRPVAENPWIGAPFAALAGVLAMPPPPPAGAPGPFSLADPARVREILAEAGFADIEVAAREAELALGGDLAAAVAFSLEVGPASRLIEECDAAQRRAAARAVSEALAPFARPGGVALPGAVWVVTARKPG